MFVPPSLPLSTIGGSPEIGNHATGSPETYMEIGNPEPPSPETLSPLSLMEISRGRRKPRVVSPEISSPPPSPETSRSGRRKPRATIIGNLAPNIVPENLAQRPPENPEPPSPETSSPLIPPETSPPVRPRRRLPSFRQSTSSHAASAPDLAAAHRQGESRREM